MREGMTASSHAFGRSASVDPRGYGTTPKGIAGPIGGIIDAFKPSFEINVKDPFSPAHREIGARFIQPKQKFDSIFEEYVHKRKMIDANKKTVADDDEGGAAGGDNKQAQIDALTVKIEVLQKNAEIELKHAKEYAAKVAKEMLDKKLMEARYSYEEEHEHIAA